MKKLIAVALAAVAFCAVAEKKNVVESDNTVGFNKIKIVPGLNLIGTAFLKVDCSGRPDIQATFLDCKGKAHTGEGDDVADYIQIFDWSKKGYFNNYFFYANPEEPDPDYDYKWLDNNDYEPTDFVIPSCNAFWYTARGEETFELTAAGGVGEEDVQVTLKPGLNLIVNPFPCDLVLNSEAVNWQDAGCNFGEGDDVADYIQVFDGERKGYFNNYFFYANPAEPDPDYDYKWLDNNDYEPTDFAVPANGGFWYTCRGDKDITLTFKCPLAK